MEEVSQIKGHVSLDYDKRGLKKCLRPVSRFRVAECISFENLCVKFSSVRYCFFFKKRQRKPGTRVSSLELSANFGRRFGKFRAAQAQCATKVLRVSVLIRRPVFNFFPPPFERGIAGKSLIFGSQDVFPVRPVVVFSRKVFRVFTKRKGIYKKQEIPSTRK